MIKWSWPTWTACSSSHIKQGSAKWRQQNTHWGEGHTQDLFKARCSNCLQLFLSLSCHQYYDVHFTWRKRWELNTLLTWHTIIRLTWKYTIYCIKFECGKNNVTWLMHSYWPAGISIQMLYLRRTITTSPLWTTSHTSWTASGECVHNAIYVGGFFFLLDWKVIISYFNVLLASASCLCVYGNVSVMADFKRESVWIWCWVVWIILRLEWPLTRWVGFFF